MAKQKSMIIKNNPKPEGPRERILATSTRLFFSQGYNSTGINQILEEAKVAKASLYQHFRSKEELGVVYLQSAREEMFFHLDTWTNRPGNPAQKLLACFDYLEETLGGNGFRGCKFINMLAEIADSSPLLRKEVIEHKTKLRERMKGFVSGALPENKETDAIGDAIYLLFEGAMVESKIFNDTWPVKTARNMAARLLQEAKQSFDKNNG